MLRTLGIIVKGVILLPILAAIVLLAVANGQDVTLHLNPFDTTDPVLRIDLPLYQIVFAIFILGVLVGGFIVWSERLKHRRRARERRETELWQARADWSERRQEETRPPQASGFLPRPERG